MLNAGQNWMEVKLNDKEARQSHATWSNITSPQLNKAPSDT